MKSGKKIIGVRGDGTPGEHGLLIQLSRAQTGSQRPSTASPGPACAVAVRWCFCGTPNCGTGSVLDLFASLVILPPCDAGALPSISVSALALSYIILFCCICLWSLTGLLLSEGRWMGSGSKGGGNGLELGGVAGRKTVVRKYCMREEWRIYFQ